MAIVLRAALAATLLCSLPALAGRLAITLEAPGTTEAETTAGGGYCLSVPGRVVRESFSGTLEKTRRDNRERYCIPAVPHAIKVEGVHVVLEWADGAAAGAAAAAPAATAAAAPLPAAATKARVAAGSPAASGASAANAVKEAEAQAHDRAQAVLEQFRRYTVDVAIPESPAFTVLNVSPTEVVRPATLRSWATALQQGVDKDGKLKTGLAVDAAPYALLNRNLSLFEYTQMNAFEKALMNTHVSMATAKGSESDDPSMKLGIGLNVRLFDRGDPREDAELTRCFRAAAGGQRPATDFFGKPGGVKAANFEDCIKLRKDARWNSTSASLGLGQAWSSPTGNLSDRERSTRGAWLSAAYGFEDVRGMADNFQLLAHYKRLERERVADPLDAAKSVDRDSRISAVQMRFGIDSFAGMLEQSWQRLSIPGREGERIRRYAIGLEMRIAKDMWLVASTGGERGGRREENDTFVNGGIRFGAATSSTFGPP